VRSKIFKLLVPCNLVAKEIESWNKGRLCVAFDSNYSRRLICTQIKQIARTLHSVLFLLKASVDVKEEANYSILNFESSGCTEYLSFSSKLSSDIFIILIHFLFVCIS